MRTSTTVAKCVAPGYSERPNAMRIRRCSVEHPFGTIKSGMGATHFLTKGLARVKTERSLHVLAYNLKRLMTFAWCSHMIEAVRAYALLLALQRVFGAMAVQVRSAAPKIRHRSLSGSESRRTRTAMYSSAAEA